ncbi:MAG TPA: hypothetical protein VJA83_07565 [Sulfuricurvum sp.]|nr:hypothetical protein [Sulfuricurvum sp.]
MLLHEETESLSERYFGLSTQKFILAASVVLSVGVYMGFIFFGDNSLSVLLELEEHQNYLSEDIERLKAENAALQKQYFELRELDADSQ